MLACHGHAGVRILSNLRVCTGGGPRVFGAGFLAEQPHRRPQDAVASGPSGSTGPMVICVEAGLSVYKATMRTAEELRLSQPAIADELNLVYLEQRAAARAPKRGSIWESAPASTRFVRWRRS